MLLVAAAAQAADPFYLRLLREGADAYNRKNYATAVQKLRVACFGFLDEPDVLAEGLTRLALAQAAAGDKRGFVETFERIADVEDRFKGYSRAKTPADLRAAFEHLVVQDIPRATLAERPAFARLIPSPADRLSKMNAAQRRRELERLFKSEPTAVKWPLMLADLSLSQGNAEAAVAAAEKALKVEPGNKEALRLRGLALAAERRWQPALDDLTGSGSVGTDRAATEAGLRCLVELARFQEASALYTGLPQTLAGDRAIRQLSGVAAVGIAQANATPTPRSSPERPTFPPTATARPTLPATPTSAPTSTATRAATWTPTPTPSPSATTAPSPIPTATRVPTGAVAARTPTARERAELAAIRDLMQKKQFDEAFVSARRLADEHADLVEAQFVAAELAYRTRRFAEAVTYFRRGGDPGDARPHLLFDQAVSLYETGDRNGAAPLLRRALSKIKRTSYVDEYVLKILGPGAMPLTRP